MKVAPLLLGLVLAACASAPVARVHRSAAPSEAGLVAELRAMRTPFPDVIPWRHVGEDEELAEGDLWDFGYVACSHDVGWQGEPSGVAWFRRPAEVGMVRAPEHAAIVSDVLEELGVPSAYEMSQGTCLVVPGRLWSRAVRGLQADERVRGMIAFVDVAARPVVDHYESSATTEDELRDELQRIAASGRELPDCVVAWDVPGWGSEDCLPELYDDSSWWRQAGYQLGDFWIKPIHEPTGIGEVALFLRPKVVACVLTEKGLDWATRELHLHGIPSFWWLSNGVYLEVPGRREREALDILHDSANRPAIAGSIYPRK